MTEKQRFVSWRRVSTGKQGKSGLGLDAQADIISHFISIEGGELIKDFCEVYTGTELSGCEELRAAINLCKAENATLIIAKSDRFRNTAEALKIYEEMNGRIYFCDLPSTDKFTLTLFFALAEREALLVSIRTKAALDAKKRRGEATGGVKELWGTKVFRDDKEREKARIESTKKAREAMAVSRRNKARENPNNKAFLEFMELWIAKHGEITWQADWKGICQELQKRGKRTSTGLEFTPNRAMCMWNNLKKMGIVL